MAIISFFKERQYGRLDILTFEMDKFFKQLTRQASRCQRDDCSQQPALRTQFDLWTEDLLHSK